MIFPYLIFSAYLISSYLGASLIFLPKISTSYDFSTRVHLAYFTRLTHTWTCHVFRLRLTVYNVVYTCT